MPDARLSRTRQTLPSDYQFGDHRVFGWIWSYDVTLNRYRWYPWTVAQQRRWEARPQVSYRTTRVSQ